MKRPLAVGYIAGLLLTFASAQGNKSQSRLQRNWHEIPVSKLGQQISSLCEKLDTVFKQHVEAPQPENGDPQVAAHPKIVVTPFQCNDSKVNTWRIETFVHRLVERDLRSRGLDVVEVTPFLDYVQQRAGKSKKKSKSRGKSDKPVALPKLRFTSKLIGRAAETTGANTVAIGICKFGSQRSHITVRIHGGSPRRRLASKTVTIATRELDLLRNTPATNRKVIQWVEQKLGERVDRGECWDLANRAFASLGIRRAGGSTKWGELIRPGEAILPGDVIQWHRKETGGRHHTAVVHDIVRPDHVKVLHQNWAGGAERGRVVGPGSYGPAGLKSARIYRPIPPE